MAILRYPTNDLVVSMQDPFEDTLDWLGFLCAKEYLIDLLNTQHAIAIPAARTRAAAIIPHVRIAISYIRQSLEGPADISFLPAYYAILNLLKVYVLLGPRHAELPANRWHGATYDVLAKDSHSILTEFITLKKGGVFPLFYETVTGKSLPPGSLKVQMKSILPYVHGVDHEYRLATGESARTCALDIEFANEKGKIIPVFRVVHKPHGVKVIKSSLKLLKGFAGRKGKPDLFFGKPVAAANQMDAARAQLNKHLIYRISPTHTFAPLCSQALQLPEELPIALLFFYMGSVVRYKPEFFRRVQDSKFWPYLSAARTHSFYGFLLNFWSFMQQKNYFVNHRLTE